MAWRVWGTRWTTSDMTTTTLSQKFIPNDDILLLAVRTWVIVYNNPTFTALNMKLYSDNGGSVGTLLHTSDNTQLKASIHTSANAVKEIYFEFNAPTGIPLKSSDSYHIVINGTGYTGNDSTHLAWMKAFPDPVYQTGISVTFNNLAVSPYAMYFIGARL